MNVLFSGSDLVGIIFARMVLRQPGAVLMDAIFVVTSMSIVFFRGHQPAAFIRFVHIIAPRCLHIF